MSFPPAEQSLSHNLRPQQASNSRARPCYRDRQASISSQPGISRTPIPPVTSVRASPQKRHTALPYASRQAISIPTSVPRPAIAAATNIVNAIKRSDIRILTDQFRSSHANQPPVSIVEIGGRSLPLTEGNLDRFLDSCGIWDTHPDEVEFEGPAKDRLRKRVVDWQDGVKLASEEHILGSPISEFRI